jgi:predicted DNA-binding transcriptional regulator AlpA
MMTNARCTAAAPAIQDRIARPQEAALILGYKSRQSLYDLVSAGLLERPIKIGLRASGWRVSTLNAFLARREAASK